MINLFNNLSDLINFIVNSFMDIFEFIFKVFELISILISFIPQPFRNLTLSFVSIYLIIYLWKIYKGGS